jgi:hypothetical protein
MVPLDRRRHHQHQSHPHLKRLYPTWTLTILSARYGTQKQVEIPPTLTASLVLFPPELLKPKAITQLCILTIQTAGRHRGEENGLRRLITQDPDHRVFRILKKMIYLEAPVSTVDWTINSDDHLEVQQRVMVVMMMKIYLRFMGNLFIKIREFNIHRGKSSTVSL